MENTRSQSARNPRTQTTTLQRGSTIAAAVLAGVLLVPHAAPANSSFGIARAHAVTTEDDVAATTQPASEDTASPDVTAETSDATPATDSASEAAPAETTSVAAATEEDAAEVTGEDTAEVTGEDTAAEGATEATATETTAQDGEAAEADADGAAESSAAAADNSTDTTAATEADTTNTESSPADATDAAETDTTATDSESAAADAAADATDDPNIVYNGEFGVVRVFDYPMPEGWTLELINERGDVTITSPTWAVPGTVELFHLQITYPDGREQTRYIRVTVLPPEITDDVDPNWNNATGTPNSSVTIDNVGDQLPDGSVVVVDNTNLPEGWTVVVNDDGSITISTPEDAEVGQVVTIPITVTYSDGSTDAVSVEFTVQAAEDASAADGSTDDASSSDAANTGSNNNDSWILGPALIAGLPALIGGNLSSALAGPETSSATAAQGASSAAVQSGGSVTLGQGQAGATSTGAGQASVNARTALANTGVSGVLGALLAAMIAAVSGALVLVAKRRQP